MQTVARESDIVEEREDLSQETPHSDLGLVSLHGLMKDAHSYWTCPVGAWGAEGPV